jgi:hypothetical protein
MSELNVLMTGLRGLMSELNVLMTGLRGLMMGPQLFRKWLAHVKDARQPRVSRLG